MDQLMYETRKTELQAIIARFDAEEIFALLMDFVEPHTGRGLLEKRSYASKPYDWLPNVMMSTTPIANVDLAPYGPKAHKAFPVIQEAWAKQQHLLAMIAALMEPGAENISLVTNHSNIIDIALVLGALRLEIEPYLSPELFSAHSTLIISRAIAATKLCLTDGSSMPSIEVIQFMSNVAMSFPTTESRRKIQFPAGLVRASNELTRLEIEYQRSMGGQLCAYAPSSSQDRFFTNGVNLQPLMDGTMDMMQGIVIPVAVSLDPPHGSDQPPGCTILAPRRVRSYSNCHAMMHEIARECHRLTLVTHTYHSELGPYRQLMRAANRRRSHN